MSEQRFKDLLPLMSARHWDCPVCGEGYPSIGNAGVPPTGAIILIYDKDLDALKPHLPADAVIRHVKDGERQTTA